jgi:hypothetical protein
MTWFQPFFWQGLGSPPPIRVLKPNRSDDQIWQFKAGSSVPSLPRILCSTTALQESRAVVPRNAYPFTCMYVCMYVCTEHVRICVYTLAY